MDIKVDINRFKNDVAEYRKTPILENKILLYGSSFFGVWGRERAARHLTGLFGDEIAVVNNGFGGSTAEDQLYHYRDLVYPYKPKGMIIRSGLNDINAGYTPQESIDLLERVVKWARNDFNDIKIILLSIFDCPVINTWNNYDKIKNYNMLLQNLCDGNDYLEYLDISPFFYNDSHDIGSLRNFKDVFQDDGLHIHDAGYELLKDYFKDEIIRIWSKYF